VQVLPESWREAAEAPWKRVSTPAFGGLSALFALVALVWCRSQEGWVPILDSANLVFHEAGHPLFGLLGDTAALYGGTLMQLLVPLLVLGSAWLRREAGGVAAAGAWLAESLLNVARYVADARAQALPLVGGGEHDWANILGRWGLLGWDRRLAGLLTSLACLGWLAAWAWLLRRWRSDPAE
jgi:hypothetical protein